MPHDLDPQTQTLIDIRVSSAEIVNLKYELKTLREDHSRLHEEVKQVSKVIYVVVVISIFISIVVAPFLRDWVVGNSGPV